MEDWGKYLKNAVANVEQQLDKVLQENQKGGAGNNTTHTQPVPRSSSDKGKRTGLQERLRQAANGRSSQDSARSASGVVADLENSEVKETLPPNEISSNSNVDAAIEQVDKQGSTVSETNTEPQKLELQKDPELFTVSTFVTAPEFGLLLTKARQLALEIRRDDALELTEGLESFNKEFQDFEENVRCRLISANSKLAVLSREKSTSSTALEAQVAALVEEGTRLSKRELDLSTVLKKLRADRQAAIKKCEQIPQKDSEIQALKDTLKNTTQKLRDMEAEIEHHRSYKENTSGNPTQEGEGTGSLSADNTQLELKTKAFIEEREKWHVVEAELLSRIAELEQAHDRRNTVNEQLQQRLLDAQKAASSARDEQVALQDELDTLKRTHTQNERHLEAKLKEAEEKVAALEEAKSMTQVNSTENSIKSASPDSGDARSIDSDLSRVVNSPSIQPLDESSLRISPAASIVTEKEFDTSGGLSRFDQDQVALGPSGPFGTLADDFDPNHQPVADRSYQETFPESFDDANSFLNTSRRESSMLGSENMSGTQLHLIRKLTASLRRMENELSTAQKSAELSKQQRLDAQAEIARLLEVQDELESLQTANKKLGDEVESLKEELKTTTSAKADYQERIEELDADVRDLKEMYKEQIEALIGEIETLKRA